MTLQNIRGDIVDQLIEEDQLLIEAKNIQEKLIEWRRDFHQHPELGFEEVRTSTIVANYMETLGLEVQREVAGTGVIALLEGDRPGPTVGLRADMDALPIQDLKDTPYKSIIEGKMHACGHDAHTTILMGAATILTKQGLGKGNIKFIFQPAEEGRGGATAMIEAGCLENPKVDIMAGLHVNTGIDTGHITVTRDRVGCGSADFFDIEIKGSGGHAAHPHQTVDAITVASEVISALQQIVSRQVAPNDAAVVTVGTIEGGSASNVIAPSVKMSGTVRTLNPDVRHEIPQKMEQVISGVTSAFGAKYEFNYEYKFPSILNDYELRSLVEEVADIVLGEGHCTREKSGLGGEDFAFYSEKVPSIFFRLGVGNEYMTRYPGHHPMFDIDEKALPYGSAMLARFALQYINSN
ncbi:amidohydrolase [Piscibacillus halophilus]|uniref:Amidohydrolase n=1 Tax=Piscibacillus halophilus TaxID=571933 RepID=A0A1H9FK19_9BACI|nr:amidohydrolase [Piscibacillus halophilus]SEQ38320.1 amidohydrolase [Piscibacillus halophilus]